MKKLYLSDDPVFVSVVFDTADYVVVDIFDSEEEAKAYVDQYSCLDYRNLNVTHIAHCFQFEVDRLMSFLMAEDISLEK